MAVLAPYDAQTRIVTTRGPPPLSLSLSLPFGELASNGEEDPTTMTSLTSHRIFQLRPMSPLDRASANQSRLHLFT